jgi:hypothetical protein
MAHQRKETSALLVVPDFDLLVVAGRDEHGLGRVEIARAHRTCSAEMKQKKEDDINCLYICGASGSKHHGPFPVMQMDDLQMIYAARQLQLLNIPSCSSNRSISVPIR